MSDSDITRDLFTVKAINPNSDDINVWGQIFHRDIYVMDKDLTPEIKI